MKVVGITLSLLIVFTLITPLVAIIHAETPQPPNEPVTTEEPPRDMPVFEFRGWGRIRTSIIFNMDFNEVLEFAYTIRNITYPLYEWELQYNVTAANVSMRLGDRFLERALNTSSEQPHRAKVYAYAAAIHYSHIPVYAHPVLGRVIRGNLGENETITEETVKAVINVSSELKNIVLNAVDYASSKGYNTTLVVKVIEWADEKLENATTTLEGGNTTLAFRLAVWAYRGYVRAYTTLVKTVFVQFIKTTYENLVEPREEVVRKAIEALPARVRETIKAKIQMGEVKSMRELVEKYKEEARKIREQIHEREKQQLKEVVMSKIRELRRSNPRVNIPDQEIEKIIGEYWGKGYRGLELARKVISAIEEKLREQGFRGPLFPGFRK